MSLLDDCYLDAIVCYDMFDTQYILRCGAFSCQTNV